MFTHAFLAHRAFLWGDAIQGSIDFEKHYPRLPLLFGTILLMGIQNKASKSYDKFRVIQSTLSTGHLLATMGRISHKRHHVLFLNNNQLLTLK
jgi:hypothetical protein